MPQLFSNPCIEKFVVIKVWSSIPFPIHSALFKTTGLLYQLSKLCFCNLSKLSIIIKLNLLVFFASSKTSLKSKSSNNSSVVNLSIPIIIKMLYNSLLSIIDVFIKFVKFINSELSVNSLFSKSKMLILRFLIVLSSSDKYFPKSTAFCKFFDTIIVKKFFIKS